MIIITGASGNIGKRLCAHFPDTFGIDLHPPTDFVGDLATINYSLPLLAQKFSTAKALIHLATSADPEAADSVHLDATTNTTRLMQACALYNIPRVILTSSNWAAPSNGQSLNAYGYSKRIFEDLAKMYSLTPNRSAIGLRIGWVPTHSSDVDGAEEYLVKDYWSDENLFKAFTQALNDEYHGLTPSLL